MFTPLASRVPATSGATSRDPVTLEVTTRAVALSLNKLSVAAGLYDQDVLQQKYMTRSDRATMQWVAQVTAGISSKFSLVRSDAIESEQLQSVYDLAMRVNELERIVTQNGLLDCFMIYKVSDTNGQRDTTIPLVNIFQHYGTMTLDQVLSSIQATMKWEPDHLVWAETLTLRLVESSCESPLRERVNERLMGKDRFSIGGATYFKIAMECITSMSYSVSMALSVRITKLSIKQFDGEDVIKVISFLRGAIQRLTMNNMLPPHMYNILQSSSTEKFNAFFDSLYAQKEADAIIKSTSISLDVETLFHIAENQYQTLLEDGSWVSTTKKGSGFIAGMLCWRCRKEDHMAKDCPDADTSNQSTRSNSNNNRNQSTNRSTAPWKKPPGPGEPHTRTHKGKEEFWCDKCKWNRTHKTKGHKTKEQLIIEMV